jgi:hypothetical protein
MQFGAHMQPAVAHFFEQAFIQAFTSQLTASAGDANVAAKPTMKTVESKASDKRRDMDTSRLNRFKNGIHFNGISLTKVGSFVNGMAAKQHKAGSPFRVN